MISAKDVPSSPGCYLFRDKKENIIYVGKAKNLKKRVSSYFKIKQEGKTKSMVDNISSLDFIATNNEVEAMLLENNLIKKNQPKYNINLKDAKRYAYILLTNEKFPRLILSRKRSQKGKYFGPFVSGFNRKSITKTISKSFKLRTCKKLPKKECLRYHIGLCSAPCIGKISQHDYKKSVKKAEMVLEGKTEKLIQNLKIEMKKNSKSMMYEKSLELRDQIFAMEDLNKRQLMERNQTYNEDVINFKVKGEKVYLIVFNVSKGTLNNKQEYQFDYKKDFLEEFIVQYYSESNIPNEVILPKKLDKSLEKYLKKISGKSVKLTNPSKGEKKDLLKLVLKNIELSFFNDLNKLKELRIALNLNDTPHVIECFDISHLSGTSTVGSMVQFRNASPSKENYRRFKIRNVQGIDDFMSISEVIRRRYSRLKNENSDFPDLIIVDGGKGQLNSSLNELKKLDIKIPVVSLAKKFEEIYVPQSSEPLKLGDKNPALKLMQQIRDEAHRFALSYNRLLRKKELVKK
jgi:excinuclease ABC subunit C